MSNGMNFCMIESKLSEPESKRKTNCSDFASKINNTWWADGKENQIIFLISKNAFSIWIWLFEIWTTCYLLRSHDTPISCLLLLKKLSNTHCSHVIFRVTSSNFQLSLIQYRKSELRFFSIEIIFSHIHSIPSSGLLIFVGKTEILSQFLQMTEKRFDETNRKHIWRNAKATKTEQCRTHHFMGRLWADSVSLVNRTPWER